MMISTKGRYALRVMIDLAQHDRSKYIPLIAEKVAETLNLSIENVSENTLSSTYNLFDLK